MTLSNWYHIFGFMVFYFYLVFNRSRKSYGQDLEVSSYGNGLYLDCGRGNMGIIYLPKKFTKLYI